MDERTYTPPRPTPRLRHCTVGQWVTLAGDTKPKALRLVDSNYGYFDTATVSLSHPVNPGGMEFAEGGWKQSSNACPARLLEQP